MRFFIFFILIFCFICVISARRKTCPIEYEIHCSEMKERCQKQNKPNCDMVHTSCLTSHKCNKKRMNQNKKYV